jgi:hypothetical protein
MPYYGYCAQDAERYLQTMRFSMSAENAAYNDRSKCIQWVPQPNQSMKGVPATIPGYMKGLGTITTQAEFTAPDGFLWNILKIADADGSLWWWPYGSQPAFDLTQPRRGAPANGKAGWGTGGFSAMFIDRFLGVSFDAPAATLTVNPTAVQSF